LTKNGSPFAAVTRALNAGDWEDANMLLFVSRQCEIETVYLLNLTKGFTPRFSNLAVAKLCQNPIQL